MSQLGRILVRGCLLMQFHYWMLGVQLRFAFSKTYMFYADITFVNFDLFMSNFSNHVLDSAFFRLLVGRINFICLKKYLL